MRNGIGHAGIEIHSVRSYDVALRQPAIRAHYQQCRLLPAALTELNQMAHTKSLRDIDCCSRLLSYWYIEIRASFDRLVQM